MTPGGLLFWDGDSDEASLQPTMAATLLLLKYAPMASSTTKANQYTVSNPIDSANARHRPDSAELRSVTIRLSTR